jgi:hypothetical protein
VTLATNRLSVTLLHADHPTRVVRLEIQHHHGRLTARVRDAGWLGELTDGQLRAFKAALAGFYKRCDVDLVREQLVNGLPGPLASLEFAPDSIVVRSGLHDEPMQYQLNGEDPASRAALSGLVFAWVPIGWMQWVECWRRDQDGQGNPGLGLAAEWLVSPVGHRPPPSMPSMEVNGEAIRVSELGRNPIAERIQASESAE